jgi:hypothetical protein
LSLRLTEITQKLSTEARNAKHLVIFDACRNELKLPNAGLRKNLVQSRGFAPVRDEGGMLIAFATEEGKTASDVGANAGPFASVLAEEMVKPGREAVVVMGIGQSADFGAVFLVADQKCQTGRFLRD